MKRKRKKEIKMKKRRKEIREKKDKLSIPFKHINEISNNIIK